MKRITESRFKELKKIVYDYLNEKVQREEMSVKQAEDRMDDYLNNGVFIQKGNDEMIEKYEITIDRPEGVTIKEMKEYIEDAIDMYHGYFNDYYSEFGVNLKIKVKRIKNEKL